MTVQELEAKLAELRDRQFTCPGPNRISTRTGSYYLSGGRSVGAVGALVTIDECMNKADCSCSLFQRLADEYEELQAQRLDILEEAASK